MTESTDQTTQDESAPADFAGAGSLVRSLIATRAIRKQRLQQADVSDAMATIGRFLTDAPSPSLRLEATSLLGKASETFNSKDLTEAIAALVGRGLAEPLPAVGEWGNADDRYYLAKAVSLSDAPWIPQYAAQALARAEVNEKLSRDTWAELAISRATDLATALGTIARAVTEWLSGRENQVELAYRKLSRICEALTKTLLTADVPVGQDFGNAFAAVVRIAGGGKGAEVLRIREETALAVLDLVIQVLRLRFEALFDSDIYRAVGAVRSWWRPARPPDGVEQRTDRIARLAMQALHILARQGVRDQELRGALARSLDPARINAAGRAVASADMSLDAQVSKWLATGQQLAAARTSETIEDLNELALDELLAQLLLTVGNQDVNADAIAAVADAIELFEPTQAAVVRNAAGRLQVINQWVDAIASKRRLATYATRGELVRFDPTVHDAGEATKGGSEVRVIVPGVVRTVEGRPPAIIIRATVDQA